MALGYIYVLSNPAFGTLLKVGFTCGNVAQRARELSSATGVPNAFVIEYFHLTFDVEDVESAVHAALPRHSSNREFFTASLPETVAVVHRFLKPPPARYERPKETAKRSAPINTCRRCGAVKPLGNLYCPKSGF